MNATAVTAEATLLRNPLARPENRWPATSHSEVASRNAWLSSPCSRLTSSSFRGVPSGLLVSKLKRPS